MEDSKGSNLYCRGRISSLFPKLSLLVKCTSVIFKKREDHLSSMHQCIKKRKSEKAKKRKGESLSPQCITKRKSVPLNEVSMMEIETDLGGAFHCFGIF